MRIEVAVTDDEGRLKQYEFDNLDDLKDSELLNPVEPFVQDKTLDIVNEVVEYYHPGVIINKDSLEDRYIIPEVINSSISKKFDLLGIIKSWLRKLN